MNPEQLDLRDVHLPEAIGWWPLAPGWWAVLIALIFIMVLSYLIVRYLKRPNLIKQAQQLLRQIKEDQQLDNHQKLQALSAWLRQAAINFCSRSKAAHLTGQTWLIFLDRDLKTPLFTQTIGQLLIDMPYRPPQITDHQLNQLVEICEIWLKAQKRVKR